MTGKKLRKGDAALSLPDHHKVPVEPDVLREFEEAAELLCSGRQLGPILRRRLEMRKGWAVKELGLFTGKKTC